MHSVLDRGAIRLVALGGLGEFGLNALVLEWEDHRLLSPPVWRRVTIERANQAAAKGVNQLPAKTPQICGSAYHTKYSCSSVGVARKIQL